jgi:Trk K+ transport system NAD-binding subunit
MSETPPPPPTRIVVTGPDSDGLGDALTERGADVRYAAGTANRPALEEAGIVDADVLVITDAGLATSVPIAKDLNPELRVVVYTRDSVPEFVKGQAGHIVDPDLLDADAVAEEIR